LVKITLSILPLGWRIGSTSVDLVHAERKKFLKSSEISIQMPTIWDLLALGKIFLGADPFDLKELMGKRFLTLTNQMGPF